MLARSILSLVKTTITGGTKLLVKSFLAITGAKRRVKKGKKIMEKNLVKFGLPRETASEIADSYASIGNEFLSIRKIIKMARNFDYDS